MTTQLRIITAAFIAAASISVAHAQQAAPAAAAPKVKADAAADIAPIIHAAPDPAVDTIVDSNPQTPAQLLRAAETLATLDRPDLAKKYLQQLAAMKLDENALAEAGWRVDPTALLRLATNPALQPEGRQLADAVQAAAAKLSRDPRRLQSEIDKLADPSRTVQREALTNILAGHEDAVPALVLALSDPNRAALHPLVKQSLVQIGAQAVPPLVTALQSDNAALVVNVIDVLSRIGSHDAVIYLAAPASSEHYLPEVRQAARAALADLQGIKNPTAQDAVNLLTKEIYRYVHHDVPLNPDINGFVPVWHWDAAAKVPVREMLPLDHAYAAIAGRGLGLDLLRLAPDDHLARRLVTVATLDHITFSAAPDDADARAKLEKSFHFSADDIATLEDVLAYAIETKHFAAALAAAEILGDIGDASILRAKDGIVRPLVTAVAQGDPRTRFAAAEAIMKLKPTEPFAGSSDLLATLAFFADAPGKHRALVAFPTEGISSRLATMLSGLGFEVDTVGGGHEAYLQALRSGDYELAILSGRLDHPPIWVVLQELRREPRTARLPIVLLAETGDVPYLESVAGADPLTIVFERPTTADGMKFYLDRLLGQAVNQIVPAELRQQHAAQALVWLKQLYEVSPRDFSVRPFEAVFVRALMQPATSAAAADLLALIGSHTAQKALVDLANSSIQPLPLRQHAAVAFSRAVRQWGIQLTSAEIQNQYDRYNLSASEDQAVQQLLGLILDAIEAPTKVADNNR